MGETLLKKLSLATGLPKKLVEQELEMLVGKAGKDQSLDLEELRDILAEYLQEVLLKAQEEYSEAPGAQVLSFAGKPKEL